MCLSVCDLFLSVKHFSGAAAPRISKFGTNVMFDSRYCGKGNLPAPAYSSIYLSVFLSLLSKLWTFASKFLGDYIIKAC